MPETQKPERVVRFGVFELDRQSGDLRKDGMARRRLQGQPLDVLLQLLSAPANSSREKSCANASGPLTLSSTSITV